MERKDIINQRIHYLRTIKKKREEGYDIINLDETWVDTHHTPSKQWMPPNLEHAKKIPLNKGQRFVILHAGSENGFVPGCELVFKTIHTDGRDYHSEMNSVIFFKWITEQLLPALRPKSLIVMDNASYHSVREEGTTAPTSGSRKGDMQTWLTEHNIPFDIKLLKPQLYEIIKKCKPEPKYKVDEFLKQHGHEVLRLPPYHCEFNPIELIWGDLKGFIGRNNSTFKTVDVKQLISDGFNSITKQKWKNACSHVIKKIEQKFWKSDNIQAEIPSFITNLDLDSDTDESEAE